MMIASLQLHIERTEVRAVSIISSSSWQGSAFPKLSNIPLENHLTDWLVWSWWTWVDMQDPVRIYYLGWRTVTRPVGWKQQTSYMFWQNCSYKTHTTMVPSGSTPHHNNMLFPEEGVCLLSTNSSCVQHILELRENKWKLSNGDILTLDPDIQFPWHFPVMWILDHCWEKLRVRMCVCTCFTHAGLHSCTGETSLYWKSYICCLRAPSFDCSAFQGMKDPTGPAGCDQRVCKRKDTSLTHCPDRTGSRERQRDCCETWMLSNVKHRCRQGGNSEKCSMQAKGVRSHRKTDKQKYWFLFYVCCDSGLSRIITLSILPRWSAQCWDTAPCPGCQAGAHADLYT